MDKEKKPKDKLKEYIDTTGQLPNRQLKLGVWYLRHKILLARIGLGILISFCASTVGFSLWKWGEYFLVGYWEDNRRLGLGQIALFQNYEALHESFGARDLRVTENRLFNTTDRRYDLFAVVENPNARWVAKIKYRFVFADGATETRETVLLPAAQRPVAYFGLESESFPANLRLVIENIKWTAVDNHTVADMEEYLDARALFLVDNLAFNSVGENGLAVPALSFSLINQTAFGYWEPVFYVELLNGNRVVGYIYLFFDKIISFETKPVDLRYFNEKVAFDNIRLIPIINYFDESVYIEPGQK